MSHAGFLRDQGGEPEDQVVALVQRLHTAVRQADGLPRSVGPDHVMRALEDLDLTDRDRALLRFVIRLTLAPGASGREDLAALLDAGLSERLAHDTVHVVACFAYMNRLADGLGVQIQDDRAPWARQLYGEDGWAEHLAWAR